jgi:hypothetical protein
MIFERNRIPSNKVGLSQVIVADLNTLQWGIPAKILFHKEVPHVGSEQLQLQPPKQQ